MFLLHISYLSTRQCHYFTVFFFQQCQKDSGSKLSLKDLIVRPIQRIPRYELLIQVWCSSKGYEPWHDKTNKVSVRPAKTQISLGIRQVWSESSLCASWEAKDPSFLHAYCEDSDQTGRMPRLIWVFAGRTTTLLVLLRGGSYLKDYKKDFLTGSR